MERRELAPWTTRTCSRRSVTIDSIQSVRTSVVSGENRSELRPAWNAGISVEATDAAFANVVVEEVLAVDIVPVVVVVVVTLAPPGLLPLLLLFDIAGFAVGDCGDVSCGAVVGGEIARLCGGTNDCGSDEVPSGRVPRSGVTVPEGAPERDRLLPPAVNAVGRERA